MLDINTLPQRLRKSGEGSVFFLSLSVMLFESRRKENVLALYLEVTQEAEGRRSRSEGKHLGAAVCSGPTAIRHDACLSIALPVRVSPCVGLCVQVSMCL